MRNISSLNWGAIEIIYLSIAFAVGFLTTYFVLPHLIKILKKKGFVGKDIHKNAAPEVAESGGISIIVGVAFSSVVLMILFPTFFNEVFIFLITVLIAALIGFIDDELKLRSLIKIALTILAGSALFFANLFGFIDISSPFIPFLGQTRLTILYPLVIPLIIAVFANSVNMLEGYNGEGSGTCLIAAIFMLICALLWNSAEALLFSVITIGVLIPFFLFNKYPAKVFPGDIGTLSMGAMLACIAIFGNLEVALFCALLLQVFNSFYVLSSVRGFLESSKIQKESPDIILMKDDLIKASTNKKAALTIPRLVLVKGPLTEPDLVKNFFVISIICGFFSIVSVLIALSTLNNSNVLITSIMIIILMVPTLLLLYKFPRIRAIVIFMFILLISGVTILILIDNFIMKMFVANIEILFLKIPSNILISFIIVAPGLALWYLITIKFFWRQINKIEKIEANLNNKKK